MSMQPMGRDLRLLKQPWPATILVALLVLSPGVAVGGDKLVQIKQDFRTDPGWEGIGNRVEATGAPTVKQEFGWSPGKIGGTVWKSTTPAWYGMPLSPPLSFKDKFSASGKITVLPGGREGVAYLGFFNHERQGWRPWSSMAMRIVNSDKAYFYLDYMTGLWNAGAAEMDCSIPADGSVHEWTLSYDPEATRAQWSDLRLRSYLTTARQEIPEILAKAKQAEPELSAEKLKARLNAALELGLVTYLPRHGTEYWVLKQYEANLKGAVTVELDGQVYRTYLTQAMRDQPVALNRFGIFNMQMYHGKMTFFVSDLVVNGKSIDLSTKPDWKGHGNRAEFVEQDFQRQNFGYSADTNLAGGRKGEIGGQFYNVEPIDPLHGYYADEIGKLTLDDPIRFSGKIAFTEGSTDAGMFFGYFNAADEQAELPPNDPKGGATGWPQPNTLGVVIDGPASNGWWFMPFCAASDKAQWTEIDGHIFLPTRKHRTFEFAYDPQANNGVGQVTVKLDGEKPFTMNLTAKQRKAGATFDRFGLMSFRRGGKFSTLYFDDLMYTARRPKGYQPVRHEQKVRRVPYPAGGRKY